MTTNNSAKILKKVSSYVHLFLLLILPYLSNAQTNINAPLDKEILAAYNNILKLRLDDGKSALAGLSKDQQASAMFHYAKNLSDIIGLLLNENEEAYKLKSKSARQSIQLLQKLPSTDPYKRFVIAEIKLSWAFLKLKFGDSFSAGWDIKQANKLINENESVFPAFPPNLKSRATLNLLIGAVPSKYNWVLNLFGLEGNIDLGLKQLQQMHSSHHFLNLEAGIIRCLSGVYLLQDKALANSFKSIYENEHDNLLVKFAYAAICIKSHKSEEALHAIKDAEKLVSNYSTVHYLQYMKGKIMLQKKNYSLALLYLNNFLKRYKGRNNIKEASFQIFLGYWLNHNTGKAKKAFESAKVQGAAISTADKYVNNILTTDNYPHRAIMQLRLATDGGYYDLANADINSIQTKNLPTVKLKAEFNYRKARYYHLTQEIDQAIEFYRNTIESAKNNHWYFAPSSAFQLGNILLERKDLIGAKTYFEKVMSYKKHPYKQSLDQQANALISKIDGLLNDEEE